jgi:hypothetical protein
VVTISIASAALASIEATLPEGSHAEARPDGNGDYLMTLPHGGAPPAVLTNASIAPHFASGAASRCQLSVRRVAVAGLLVVKPPLTVACKGRA